MDSDCDHLVYKSNYAEEDRGENNVDTVCLVCVDYQVQDKPIQCTEPIPTVSFPGEWNSGRMVPYIEILQEQPELTVCPES